MPYYTINYVLCVLAVCLSVGFLLVWVVLLFVLFMFGSGGSCVL